MKNKEFKILDSFNAAAHDYDRGATVIDLFRKSAAAYPDNAAVICGEKVFTYAQTDRLSSSIARFINSVGLGRGDVVGVFIPRNEYMVIASLGVLRSGCAYEPLDPGYPDARLSFMARDAGIRLIIADDGLRGRLSGFLGVSCPVLWLSRVPLLPEGCEDSALPVPDDLFALMYTSGSAGIPKGVRLLHRNVAAYCAWYRRALRPTPDWRVTCYNSYGFDASLGDIYPALTAGAATVIIPEDGRLDLSALAALIDRWGIVLADLPSQVLRQFAMTMKCPSLKILVAGGEKLMPFKSASPYLVVNEYGPTETTVAVTSYRMTGEEGEIPIGKPMDNTALYVVNEAGERVGIGEAGELWVAGEQVSGGYLNRPEETARAFIPNPFSDDPAYATVYRTGDIVRYRRDGNIEFIGRRDGMVKIRGFRVELDEVKKAILEYPGVLNAAVADFDHPGGGKFLAAYVVSDSVIDTKALEAFIGRSRPAYMVPAVMMQIDAIPLNPNGKPDKAALPVPKLKTTAEYTAPVGETETKLTAGFAAALGLERAGAELDFFAAGGDSLRVMRLIQECRSLPLSFKMIYEGRTPRGIAALIGKRTAADERPVRETHFLGPLHETFYVWGNEAQEGYGLHCESFVHLGKNTDPTRLANAVEAALRAHPAADARLTEVNGTLRWRPGSMENLRPTTERITRASYDEQRKHLRRAMNKPETRMFTARIFEIIEPDSSISRDLYLDFLHQLTDGYSIDLLLEEINRAYSGEALEPEAYTVFDYYDEMEERIHTGEYEAEREWNRRFLSFFTDRLSILTGDLDCGECCRTRIVVLPLALDLEALDRYADEKNVSIASLLAAAYGFMAGSCNGETAAVGITIYNARDDTRYARTFGALYRHYPLCVKWTEDMSADDFVRNTQENIMLCRLHALYEADPVPVAAGFAYQGEDLDLLEAFCGDAARYEEVEDNADESEDGFELYVFRGRNGLRAKLSYNSLQYSDEFVSDFLSDYVGVVRAIVSGTAPSEIGIVTVKNHLLRGEQRGESSDSAMKCHPERL